MGFEFKISQAQVKEWLEQLYYMRKDISDLVVYLADMKQSLKDIRDVKVAYAKKMEAESKAYESKISTDQLKLFNRLLIEKNKSSRWVYGNLSRKEASKFIDKLLREGQK